MTAVRLRLQNMAQRTPRTFLDIVRVCFAARGMLVVLDPRGVGA